MKRLLVALLLLGCAPPGISMHDVVCAVPERDGKGEAAGFPGINALATGADGTVYVCQDQRLRVVSPSGDVTTRNLAPAPVNSSGCAVGADAVYVVEYARQRILAVDPAGTTRVLAGELYQNNDSDDNGLADGTGDQARFASPRDLCLDPDGNLIVADTFNHRLRKVTPQGQVTTLAGSGKLGNRADAGTQDGKALEAKLHFPVAVARAADGTIYFGDEEGRLLRKLGPDGSVKTLVDLGSDFFDRIKGMDLDSNGDVYLALAGRLRRWTAGGKLEDLWALPSDQNHGLGGDVSVSPGGTIQFTDGVRVLQLEGTQAKVLAGQLPTCKVM